MRQFIPDLMLIDIFLNMDVLDLIRNRSVSKYVNQMLKTTGFWNDKCRVDFGTEISDGYNGYRYEWAIRHSSGRSVAEEVCDGRKRFINVTVVDHGHHVSLTETDFWGMETDRQISNTLKVIPRSICTHNGYIVHSEDLNTLLASSLRGKVFDLRYGDVVTETVLGFKGGLGVLINDHTVLMAGRRELISYDVVYVEDEHGGYYEDAKYGVQAVYELV